MWIVLQSSLVALHSLVAFAYFSVGYPEAYPAAEIFRLRFNAFELVINAFSVVFKVIEAVSHAVVKLRGPEIQKMPMQNLQMTVFRFRSCKTCYFMICYSIIR